MGKLYAVGFGPGGYEHMTAKAIDVIKNADIITGYTTYVEMIKKIFPEKEYVAAPMTKEMDRCRMAVDVAALIPTILIKSLLFMFFLFFSSIISSQFRLYNSMHLMSCYINSSERTGRT